VFSVCARRDTLRRGLQLVSVESCDWRRMLLRRVYLGTALLFLLHTLPVVVQAQESEGCIRTTNELNSLESAVTDYSVVRLYIVCENALWQPGSLNSFDQLSGMDLIYLRPNLHLQCGASGSRLNKCIVDGGDVQMDGTSIFAVPSVDALDNVVITGLTFSAARQSMIWITKPGTVTFRDCEFRVGVGILEAVALEPMLG
jgi:hypothetical protein